MPEVTWGHFDQRLSTEESQCTCNLLHLQPCAHIACSCADLCADGVLRGAMWSQSWHPLQQCVKREDEKAKRLDEDQEDTDFPLEQAWP